VVAVELPSCVVVVERALAWALAWAPCCSDALECCVAAFCLPAGSFSFHSHSIFIPFFFFFFFFGAAGFGLEE
jgi:hypothetical protein